MNVKPVATRIVFAFLLLAAVFAAPGWSATSEFQLLINRDLNLNSGCDLVPTPPNPPGPPATRGIEQILTATVTTGPGTATVTSITNQACTNSATDTFGPATAITGATGGVGQNNGVDGFDVVEVCVPYATVVSSPTPQGRIGLISSNLTGSKDMVFTPDGGNGNQPILLALGFTPPIPTLSEWGLILMALLLAASAAVRLRKRPGIAGGLMLVLALLGMAGVAWAVVTDGLINDWHPTNDRLATDPIGDALLGADVRALFAKVENDQLCFRIDASLDIPPPDQPPVADNDSYSVDEGGTLNVPAPGVLDGDTDPEGSPLTADLVTDPAHGTLTLNADGSFTYTHDGSETPTTDTFTYQANDGAQNSDPATVTITINAQNDAPELVAGGGSPTFTEDGPAVVVDPGLLVTDVDDTNLESATVTITNLLDAGEEVLAATTAGTSITASYVAPTLTLTGSDTLANYQQVLRSVTYENTSNTPDTTPRSVAFQVNDGAANSNVVATVVNVDPSADAPVLAGTGTVTFTEDGGPVTVAPAITATDSDDTDLESATVTITNLLDTGAEVLAANTAGTSITASYVAPTLTLTGTDTVANYQQVLRSVTYDNTSQDPDTTSRSVSFVANDGTSNGNTVTATVDMVAVNDAPTLTAGGGSPTFTEDGPAVAVDPGLLVADVDDTNLESATVTITNLLDAGAEVLAATTAGTSITASYVAPTLTLTGSDTLANYQQVLRSVTYDNTSEDPSITARSMAFVVNDGDANSNTATTTLNVAPNNDAPVLAGAGTVTFTEDGGAVAVAPALTVADADDTNLVSATVTITNLLDAGAEVLAATTLGTSITASYVAPTLTLTGSDTLANYQQVLRSVTYDNTSQNPSTTARSIAFVANDGTANSNTEIATVNMGVNNDAPVLAGAGAVSFTEDGGAVAVAPALTVTDADDTNLESAAVTITNLLDAGAEVLAATTAGTSITASYAAPTLTLTGSDTLANYQQVLRSVTYNNTSQNPSTTARSISFVANDGTANSNTEIATVNMTALNDAPVLTAGGGSPTFIEDGPAVTVDPGLLVTDGDDTNLESATVTIANLLDVGQEVLTASTAGTSIVASYVAPTLTLTGSDSVANYQQVLRSVAYANASQNPNTTARSINFTVNDGTANSNTVATLVNITTNPDAPVLVAGGGNPTFTEDGPPVVVDPGLLVTDADSLNLASAEVTITNLEDTGLETLAANTAGTSITASYVAPTLTLTGPDSVANYQQVLRSVTYNNTSNDPDTTDRVISFTVNDGIANSNTVTTTVDVVAAADAPVLTAGGGSPTFTEDGPAVTVDPGITVTDGDSTTLASAVVTITNLLDAGAEVLTANTAGTSITASYVAPTLTLTGVDTLANYQQVLRSVAYNNTSQNPNTTARGISFVVNDGAANSNTVTTTVNMVAINDAPVLANTGTVIFTEDGGPVAVAPAITATDVDDTNLESAVVTITNLQDAGQETLAANTAGTSITASYIAPTLTLTGTDTVANYQAVLRSITYNNASQNPNPTTRNVTFVVNDGALNSNTATAMVQVVPVNDAPVADDDAFDFIGNTELRVDNGTVSTPHALETTPSTFGVLDGDSDPAENNPLSVSQITVGACTDNTPPFTCTVAGFGTITMETNGRFSFVPAPGDASATETFQYTLSDGQAVNSTDVGNVTLTRFERVWYVKNDAPAGGLGRSSDPFDTLTEAQTASLANDYIFVYFGSGTTTGHTAGISLKNGQHLIGEHAGLSLPVNLNANGSPTNLVTAAAGNRPLLDDTVVDAIEGVSAVNVIPTEIVGLNLAGNVNAIDWNTNAAFAGTGAFSIRDNVIRSAAGDGVDINLAGTGATSLAFHDNVLTATGAGLDIQETGTGTLTITRFDDNQVSGDTAGSGIVINNAVFDATPGGGIDSVSGGVTVIGASGNGVGGSGLVITGMTGTLAFTDLDIFADAGAGLRIGGTGVATTNLSVGAGVATVQATGGPAVDLSTLTTDLQLTSLTSTNSASTGVALTTVNGTFSAGSGSAITNATGTDFAISGGTANVTYGGTITDDVGQLVSISGATAGTKSFTGAITDGNDGDGSGISLTGNTGATISFSGGVVLSTGANPAFAATGGGTLRVTGTTNTIATTTGTALNVANTTIHADDLTFRSISSNGAATGIVLNNTGALGGLTVSGTGGAGTGGTIQNSTGNGISLTNTRDVVLNSMVLNNNDGSGVFGDDLTNFTINNSTVTNSADTTGGSEAGLRFNELLGTSAITNTTVSGSHEDNIRLTPASGVLTNLTISGSTIGPNPVGTGGAGVNLITSGTANVTITVTNSTFEGNQTAGFNTSSTDTSRQTINVSSSIFRDNFEGMNMATSVSADMTLNLTGNTLLRHSGQAISAGSAGATTNAAQIVATISGNTIGDGTPDSGSRNSRGIDFDLQGDGDGIVSITGNTVSNSDFEGIRVQSRLDNDADAETGRLDVTLRNNVVNTPDDNSAFPVGTMFGVLVEGRNTSTLCLDIANNDSASVGASEHFRVRQRDTATFLLERLTDGDGTPNEVLNNAATIEAFVVGQNVAGSTADALFVTGITEAANGSCRKP